MMTDVKKTRIPEFDLFKGIAILLVVCGHIILENWANAIDNHSVYTWIYSFHMPLFFFISGYLIELTTKDLSICGGVKKKTLALFVPYIVWCFAIAPFINGEKLPSIRYIMANTDARYWFIYLLFLFSSIYYVGRRVFKNNYCCGGVFVGIIIFGVGFFLYPCDIFSRGLQFMPIYFFGVWARKTKLNEKEKIYKEPLLSLSLLAFIVCSLSYCHLDFGYLNKGCKFIASFALCFIALYYVNNHSINVDNKVVRALSYMGKNSIVIYLTHFFFWRVMPAPIFTLDMPQPFWALVISVVLALIIVGACLLIGKIAEKFKWFNRLVFGRGW